MALHQNGQMYPVEFSRVFLAVPSNSTQRNEQFEFLITCANRTNDTHRGLHTVTPGPMSI